MIYGVIIRRNVKDFPPTFLPQVVKTRKMAVQLKARLQHKGQVKKLGQGRSSCQTRGAKIQML